jgi:hypothetical protein
MPTLPGGFARLILPFAGLFSKRVFQPVQVRLAGAILAPGKRTMTSVLRIMGLSQEPHFQTYHRVLNRAAWSSLVASRVLLQLLVRALRPAASTATRCVHRTAISSRSAACADCAGCSWCRFPGLPRFSALPFLTAQCPSRRYHDSRGKRHKKLTDWARQMIKQVRRWLPGRHIVIVADSAFAALDFLDAARRHATVITRLRLDAALYAPAPERSAGQRGRTRLKGERLPALNQVLADPATAWTQLTLACWYGEHDRTVEVASGTAVWYHCGMPTVPLRWVLIRDPLGHFETWRASCSAGRWRSLLRKHVRIWASRPSDSGLTRRLHAPHLACSDIIASSRWPRSSYSRPDRFTGVAPPGIPNRRPLFPTPSRACAAHYGATRIFLVSPHETDMVKIPRPLLDRFIDSLCYAA